MKKLAEYDIKNIKINNYWGLLITVALMLIFAIAMIAVNIIEYTEDYNWFLPFFNFVDTVQNFMSQTSQAITNPILQFILPKLNIDQQWIDLILKNLNTINYLLDTAVMVIKTSLIVILIIKISVYVEVLIALVMGFVNIQNEKFTKAHKKINFTAYVGFVFGLASLVISPNDAIVSVVIMILSAIMMYFNDQVKLEFVEK